MELNLQGQVSRSSLGLSAKLAAGGSVVTSSTLESSATSDNKSSIAPVAFFLLGGAALGREGLGLSAEVFDFSDIREFDLGRVPRFVSGVPVVDFVMMRGDGWGRWRSRVHAGLRSHRLHLKEE